MNDAPDENVSAAPSAGAPSPKTPPTPQGGPARAELPEPKTFGQQFQAAFNGRSLTYRATAVETYVAGAGGEPGASLFTFSYLESAAAAEERPVMFVFNGGPGSSSLWLHLGALGPSRLELPNEPLNLGAPPYRVIHNDESLLDAADLVFIDPVGT